jgi:hypothetical protein
MGMTGATMSGGIVVALAAVLWLAYLVPTWLRRRDYLHAERNAVRLQQTLRVLAETSEVPEEVRLEATAREVSRQQKVLKRAQADADAAVRARAAVAARDAARFAAEAGVHRAPAEAVATPQADFGAVMTGATADRAALQTGSQDAPTGPVEPVAAGASGALPRHEAAATRAHRERTFRHAVRRTRLLTTVVILAALIGICFGAHDLITRGSWLLVAGSTALLVCAFLVLRRLAKQVAMRRSLARAQHAVQTSDPELYDHAKHTDTGFDATQVQFAAAPAWSPRPLPKPLYQSPGSRAATAMASIDAAVALRQAAARADLEERATRLAAERVPTLPVERKLDRPAERPAAVAETRQASVAERPAAVSAPPSRFARMGVVGAMEGDALDLDAALRRRRAV